MLEINQTASDESNVIPDIDAILADNGGLPEPKVDDPNRTKDIEIDPKYAHLDPIEARYRSMQSMYDRTQEIVKKLEVDKADKIKYEMFLDELMNDDDTFMAFVAERKPELLAQKETNLAERIAQQLQSEFKDYQPSEDELRNPIPGTNAWLYLKRSDELYNELKDKTGKKSETLSELKQRKETLRKEEESKLQQQIAEVKTKMGWDDVQVSNFQKWANTLTPLAFAKTFEFIQRFAKPKGTSVAGSPSTQRSTISNSRQAFLQTLR